MSCSLPNTPHHTNYSYQISYHPRLKTSCRTWNAPRLAAITLRNVPTKGVCAHSEKATSPTRQCQQQPQPTAAATAVLTSSWMVYLHSPRVFHSLMVLSRDPDTICLLSAEKATERTSFAWPTNRRVVRPDWISHNRRVPSHDPDLIRFISFVGERGEHRLCMRKGGHAA